MNLWQYFQNDTLPEIEALKIEIKKLEMDVSTASDEVVVVEKLIHDFGIRHNRELGEILSRLLRLRSAEGLIRPLAERKN